MIYVGVNVVFADVMVPVGTRSYADTVLINVDPIYSGPALQIEGSVQDHSKFSALAMDSQ